jgi:hypothetical protein
MLCRDIYFWVVSRGVGSVNYLVIIEFNNSIYNEASFPIRALVP